MNAIVMTRLCLVAVFVQVGVLPVEILGGAKWPVLITTCCIDR